MLLNIFRPHFFILLMCFAYYFVILQPKYVNNLCNPFSNLNDTMPINKNASIRYQTLDKCFRDRHRHYYIEDLMECCEEALLRCNGIGGVSRRQIFDDIRFMESESGWNIPLERIKKGKRIHYRYEDPDFSINALPLTEAEARQLRTVVQTLGRFRGLPTNEWVEDVISNLEWRFNLSGDSKAVVGFDQNKGLKGLTYLSPLFDAMTNHTVLRITYRSYKKDSEERTQTVHPYYVRQYNNRWFLLAMDNDYRTITNFALDRIVSISPAEGVEYIPNNSIDFEHYFDDVIGVTIPPKDVEKLTIQLRFSEKQFPYITSKPLHPSQVVIDQEQRILSIEVKPNYELDHHILALGPDVEVLAPASYREHIQEILLDNLKKYLPVQIERTGVH